MKGRGLTVVLWVGLPLFVASSVLAMLQSPYILMSGTLVTMALMAWLIVHFEWQQGFIKLFAFLLPFSIEIAVLDGHMILFPSEPLLVMAAFMLGIELLRKPLPITRQLWHETRWLLPLVLAFILTIPFSGMGLVSLKFSGVNLLYMAVFFMYLSMLSLRHPAMLRHLFLLYSMGFILVAFWSIYQYWQWAWSPMVLRGIFSPFYKDHTIYGAAAALLAIWWLTGSMAERSVPSKLIGLILALLFMVMIVLSGSRAAFLSLIFSLFVLLLLQVRIRLRYISLGGIVVIMVLLFYQDHLVHRLEQIDAISYDSHANLFERAESVGNITTDVSNIERMNRWVAGWRMFLEKPLTGFGSGTYQFAYIPYQVPGLGNRLTVTNPYDIPENSGGTAHSEYLLAMSEMGVLGLAGWLTLLGRWIFIAFRQQPMHLKRKQIIIAFTALSTYLFHAFFNNFLNTDKIAFLFWGMAVWLTIKYQAKDESEVLPGH